MTLEPLSTTCNHRRRCARQTEEHRVGVFCMRCGQLIESIDIRTMPDVVELPNTDEQAS